MKNLTLFLFFLLLSTKAFTQTIKGKVSDDKGLPIPSANVVNTNGASSSTTDFDGSFIVNAKPGDKLKVSMIGYKTSTVTAYQDITIVLKEEATTLQDVVVVGYGTKKMGSITGSISQIKSSEIVKTPTQSAIQAIQGKAAGVNIVSNDRPGEAPTIVIRGLGTITSGRNPLYIIDGLEASGLNGLSPNEIATIDILKDASSLSIYGQKGANGVVIISTKKGKKGDMKINFSSNVGFKFLQKKVNMADASKFAYYNNSALGTSSYFFMGDQPVNTNWLKEITQTGITTNNTVSFSGGSENANYYFGASRYTEQGVMKGNDFNRINLNSRNEFKIIKSRVKFTQNINLSFENLTPKPLSAFTDAYRQSPMVPVYFPNGHFGLPFRDPNTGLVSENGSDKFNNVGNPVASLYFSNEQSKTLTLFGNVGFEIQLLKNLKFNTSFGATYYTNKAYNFINNYEMVVLANATPGINLTTLKQIRNQGYRYNWDSYFTYNKDFAKNEINLTAGLSRTKNDVNDEMYAIRYNVPVDSNYWSLNNSFSNTKVNPADVISQKAVTPFTSVAYFVRADYQYDDKYLISTSFRREGLSKFSTNNQWANFMAASGGWVVSKESFFSMVKWLNYLKIRGGYGEVGNGNGAPALNTSTFNNNSPYSFNSVSQSGSYTDRLINENLTWEVMSETDFGIDARFIENRLSTTFDIYNRVSKKLLLPVKYPYVISPEAVYVNAGEVTNKGVELSLRWDDKIGENWGYSIGGNISYNRNELSKVNNSSYENLTGGDVGYGGNWVKEFRVGDPLGTFYVYQTTGFTNNGSFTYTANRVNAGSYIPDYTFAFNFSIKYKKIDFSTDLYGVMGNKIYNGKKALRFGGENVESEVLNNFWTPSTLNAENPYPFNQTPVVSTYYVEDGDFLRVNNITLGYTVSNVFSKNDTFRFFATATNPFIFTNYSGFSPEIPGIPTERAGIELDAYPTNKSYIVGVNIAF